jgi:phage-related protein
MAVLKDVLWEGSSYEDLLSFPQSVRHDIGYQLHLVQSGQMPTDWKPLNNLGRGISGVYEIRVAEEGNIFRTAYVARFADTVVVLHCWQKKTQTTSGKDKDLIVRRYKSAQEYLDG